MGANTLEIRRKNGFVTSIVACQLDGMPHHFSADAFALKGWINSNVFDDCRSRSQVPQVIHDELRKRSNDECVTNGNVDPVVRILRHAI